MAQWPEREVSGKSKARKCADIRELGEKSGLRRVPRGGKQRGKSENARKFKRTHEGRDMNMHWWKAGAVHSKEAFTPARMDVHGRDLLHSGVGSQDIGTEDRS